MTLCTPDPHGVKSGEYDPQLLWMRRPWLQEPDFQTDRSSFPHIDTKFPVTARIKEHYRVTCTNQKHYSSSTRGPDSGVPKVTELRVLDIQVSLKFSSAV